MGCLYGIAFENGKQYIGVTSFDLHKRYTQHIKCALKYKFNTIFYKAIRKYGIDSISKRVLVIANDSDYLKELEIKAIKSFNTKVPNGYNSTDGGNGVVNPTSRSCRLKVKHFKKTASTKWYKEKQRRVQKEYWTKENRDKHSERIKEAWKKPENLEAYRKRDEKRTLNKKPIIKSTRTKEEIRRIKSKAMKKQWENNRELWMAKRKENPCTKKTKKKISQTIKKLMSDINNRLRVSKTQSKYGEFSFIKLTDKNPFKTNGGVNATSRILWEKLPERFDYDYLWKLGLRSKHITKMINRSAIGIVDD